MERKYLFSNEVLSLTEDAVSGDVKQYRKMLFRYGDYIDQSTGERDTKFDKKLAEEVKKNFDDKVIEHVPVPVDHDRDPLANAGELISLEVGDDGLYGVIEIRDWDIINRIDRKLIFDVSIGIYWNYQDTETGEDKGATLFHVALVNDPYIEHMSDFEAILAEESDSDDDNVRGRRELMRGLATRLSQAHREKSAIMFSVSANANNRKEYSMLVDVINDREFDVVVKYTQDGEEKTATIKAGETIQVPEDQAEAVKQQIAEAEEPKEDDEMSKGEQDGEAKKEASESEEKSEETDKKGESEAKEDKKEAEGEVKLSKAQAQEYAKLRRENAELKANEAYAKMLSDGYITPAQESAYKNIKLATILEPTATQFSKADGSKFSLGDELDKLLRSGNKKVEYSQTGSRNADGESEEKPLSESLSKAEREELETRHGITASRIDELAKKNPQFVKSMNKIINKEQ